MSDVVAIIVPGPPQGKGRPRFARKTGHAYTPGPTREYEAALRGAAALEMGETPPLEGALEVGVMVFVPTPASWSGAKRKAASQGLVRPTSRPDADNYLKICLDALNGVVWRDDAQVTDAVVRKRYAYRPSLQIFVRRVQAAELLGEARAA